MRILGALWRSRRARLGLLLVLGFALMALVGPLLVGDPLDFVGRPLQAPSGEAWLGTTGQGQDVLAQTVVGARSTLLVALVTATVVLLVGSLIGGLAGYLGGRADDLLSLLINISLVLPGLPLMVVLAAWLPAGPVSMAAVLSLTGWAWHARVLRAQVLTLRQRDFVAAAQLAGESRVRILVVEILPNMAGLLASSFIGAMVYAIGAQVGLEYLGLGDLDQVTWGTNLYWASNDQALLTSSWWTFVPTGLCIALVGFGLALVNFGLDEVSNPRLAHSQRVGPTPVVR